MTKPTKWSVCPAKTLISLGIHPVWSVFTVRLKKALVLSYPLSAQRRLIRLGGCPGCSESSLGTQSFCWFCHAAAHLFLLMRRQLCPPPHTHIFCGENVAKCHQNLLFLSKVKDQSCEFQLSLDIYLNEYGISIFEENASFLVFNGPFSSYKCYV